jgi:TPR repeat protein
LRKITAVAGNRSIGPIIVDRLLWDLAEAGDARAMVCVGDGAERTEAEQWYRRAADLGEPGAMVRLAWMCLAWIPMNAADRARWRDPEVRRRHEAQAMDWYRAAAQAGHPEAISKLADITTDPEEKGLWYTRALEVGDVWAGVNWARTLASQGRDEDSERWNQQLDEEIKRWYQRIAEVYPRLAAEARGDLLVRRGQPAEAVQWYRAAIEDGSLSAMSGLAQALADLGKDDEARYWWDRASQPTASAGLGGAVILTAVLTTTIVPFIQAIVAKAADNTYTAVRQHLRKLFRARARQAALNYRVGELLIVHDPDPSLNLALHLWTDTPHEAIRALAELDLGAFDSDANDNNQPGARRRVFWNQATKSWQVLDHRK